MIQQTDLRLIKKMVEKINHLIEILSKNGRDKIQSEYVLSDAIQFEFEKLYEDSTRLSQEFRFDYGEKLQIDNLRAIRNRVAHNYESVSIKVLLDTIENDIPKLKNDLEQIIEDNK